MEGDREFCKASIGPLEFLSVKHLPGSWKIVMPAAAPQVISGLQIALPQSLIIGIVTEMLTGGDGLGSYMIRGVRFSDSETAFAGLLAMLVTGLAYMQIAAMLRELQDRVADHLARSVESNLSAAVGLHHGNAAGVQDVPHAG